MLVTDIQNACTCMYTHMAWHGIVSVLRKHVVFKKTVNCCALFGFQECAWIV